MEATAISRGQRERSACTRARAIIRFNGLLFHGLAAASFLESAAPLYANRAMRAFARHPDVGLWLEQVWQPQRAERGRQLRGYIEAMWSEFDWSAAYGEFHETCRPRFERAAPPPSLALEALRLCATEVQAAVFYRALANGADEPVLRELAQEAALEHAAHFQYFRSVFERCERRERIGLVATCRTVIECSRTARRRDVAEAFQPLAQHWYGNQPVPELGYGEFVERMVQLVRRHAALGRFERWLFRPWLKREGGAPAAQSTVGETVRWASPAPQFRAAAA